MPFDIIIGRNEADRKKLGNQGVIFLGRSYVQMGRTVSLSNNLYMDVTRSHVVYVAGKRGSGKCLTGDTLVTLSNGLEVPIKDLEHHNEKIVALDNNLKITHLEKTDFFKREVNSILKVRLRSGREIKLTPEHPLLTITGWKESKNLTVGSRVATPRKLESLSNKEMSDEEIKILAYLIAEGHIKKPMLFSNTDSTIVEDLRGALRKLHPAVELTPLQKGCFKINSRNIPRGILGYKIKRDENGRISPGSYILHENTPISKFLKEHKIYGLLSAKKFIPEGIFMVNKEKLALFLNRLFSCDGSVYKPNKEKLYWEISYASSSERLIRNVQSLLLRFEVLSKLRRKRTKCNGKMFDTFELVLDGSNVIRFIENIGFYGKKEERQKTALVEMNSLKRNTNVDTIPKEIWDYYRPENWVEVGKAFNYSAPKSLRSSINYSPSRQKLLQVAITDNNPLVKAIAQSDIFWDEIVMIEKLEGNFAVYDITVPEVHNFIANNIIVHNSYTLGVIAEGMADLPPEIKNNVAVVMLDTMGIYWPMKQKNEKDADLLAAWNLEPKALDIKIFTPFGFFKEYKDKGIPTDYPFSIKPTELNAEDWALTFGITTSDPVGVLIEKTIGDLKESGKVDYSIDDMIAAIKKDDSFEQYTKNEAVNRLKTSQRWGLFNDEGTRIDALIKGGQVTVLDVSCYATGEGGWGVKNLVMGLISKKLFIERMISRKEEELEDINVGYSYFQVEAETKSEQRKPLVWLVIDEAHECLPKIGKTAATDALVTILREGRQPGISLILATQQPGKIHDDVTTQSDIVISHRITAKTDVEALNSMTQSYLESTLTGYLNNLPSERGAALILDDNSERIYPMRVRPRFSWHGGEAPSALKVKKSMELGL